MQNCACSYPRGQKRASEPLKLELRWCLEIKPLFSKRAKTNIPWAIFLAPTSLNFNYMYWAGAWYGSVHMGAGTCKGQRRDWDHLELEWVPKLSSGN